jgi:gliding motility-associated-like protein
LGDSIYLDFASNYPVLWSDGQNSFSSSGFWIYPEENTTYTVQTVDTTQCTKYDTFTIQVRGSELANIQVDDLSGCAPLEVQFADTSMDPGINYFWDFGDGNVSMDFANTVHIYETPGNYSVSLGVEYSPECGVYWMSEYDITVDETPEADFEYEIQELAGSAFEISFENTSEGSFLTYFWDFGDGTTSIEMNPIHLYSGLGNYIINLSVTTENGCEDEISYEINIRKDLRVYIPNIFSPNRDGINDAFTINFNTPVDEYACYIYDRWGSLVFESQDQYESWDGRLNGREVLPGVYSYFIQYSQTDPNSLQTQRVKKSGSITLIR